MGSLCVRQNTYVLFLCRKDDGTICKSMPASFFITTLTKENYAARRWLLIAPRYSPPKKTNIRPLVSCFAVVPAKTRTHLSRHQGKVPCHFGPTDSVGVGLSVQEARRLGSAARDLSKTAVRVR